MSDVELRQLATPVPGAFEAMTFPAYRHLLALEPAPRHLGEGGGRVIQPIAIAAWFMGRPAGLVLAEVPLDGRGMPQMLSLYCRREFRNRGLGTALVGELEDALRLRRFPVVRTVYMTGKPGIHALQRVLEKRGWSAPVMRALAVRFAPEEAAAMPWFGRVKLSSSEYELFPWVDLTREEREGLKRSQAASPWIPSALEPWRHDSHGFDPISSVGLRHRGTVVGWVINHRILPDTVRFTCSFMRKDLGRRGRILPLYTDSIRRLLRTRCRLCTFVVPVAYRTMVAFTLRRFARWASFLAETRESRKVLTPSSAAKPRRGRSKSWASVDDASP